MLTLFNIKMNMNRGCCRMSVNECRASEGRMEMNLALLTSLENLRSTLERDGFESRWNFVTNGSC